MLLILNDIKYINYKNIILYKDKFYYRLNDIKLNGIYFKQSKNITDIYNKYRVFLDKNILEFEDEFRDKFISFYCKDKLSYVDVLKNDITDKIYKNKADSIIINIKYIHVNKFLKIHILEWKN
jgi:hypothetical protein